MSVKPKPVRILAPWKKKVCMKSYSFEIVFHLGKGPDSVIFHPLYWSKKLE